jgi:molybdate-binding protein/DNA-binding XRE family transcriptional regulator
MRGVSATELARRVGVSRQTIYAIEAGTYIPNTVVTLKLARELEVSVEEIFALAPEASRAADPIATQVLSAWTPAEGQPAQLGRIGDSWISVPVRAFPCYLPDADGVICHVGKRRGADVMAASRDDTFDKRLILAGCDPATSLLVGMVEKMGGIEIVPAAASSKLALSWLKEGKIHIAGSHLEDPQTGEFNLPYLRRNFPNDDLAVITLARWEAGLVTAPGNPKGIGKVEHLAHKAVRFVNRELGSGSRTLLDRLLREAGLPSRQVRGYRAEAYGHLAASYAVFTGAADCCIATRSAAQAFALNFVSLQSERYDLVMRRQTLELPAIQSFLDVLQRASLRRKLEVLAGYDTRQTGTVLA